MADVLQRKTAPRLLTCVSANEPPPTIAYPSMPPSVSPAEQPTLDLPGSYKLRRCRWPRNNHFSELAAAPAASSPTYASQPQKSLAVLSMVLGIVSITIGFLVLLFRRVDQSRCHWFRHLLVVSDQERS